MAGRAKHLWEGEEPFFAFCEKRRKDNLLLYTSSDHKDGDYTLYGHKFSEKLGMADFSCLSFPKLG